MHRDSDDVARIATTERNVVSLGALRMDDDVGLHTLLSIVVLVGDVNVRVTARS